MNTTHNINNINIHKIKHLQHKSTNNNFTNYNDFWWYIHNSPTATDKVSVTNTGSAIPNSINSCSLEYFANDLVMTELLKLVLGLHLWQFYKRYIINNISTYVERRSYWLKQSTFIHYTIFLLFSNQYSY